MTGLITLGIDPGDTTGIFAARWSGGVLASFLALQCPRDEAAAQVTGVINGAAVTCAQVEEWRKGRRSVRVHGTNPSLIEREIADLVNLLRDRGIPVRIRPAAEAKAWATDKRLEHAGMIAATARYPRHARDAARHALFTAVKDCGVPVPLSTMARKG